MTATESESKEVARDRKGLNRAARAALQLRIEGYTWDEIAEVIGYASAERCRVAVEQALAKELSSSEQSKQMMRTMADIRLTKLLRAVYDKATDPTHEEQMVAVGKARELIADWRKLHGLDAPMEIAVHDPTDSEIKNWVMKLSAAGLPDVTEADMFAGGEIVDGEVVEEGSILEPPKPKPVTREELDI